MHIWQQPANITHDSIEMLHWTGSLVMLELSCLKAHLSRHVQSACPPLLSQPTCTQITLLHKHVLVCCIH